MKNKKILLTILSIGLLLISPNFIFAQNNNSDLAVTITQGVSKIFSTALTISIILSAIVIVYGALHYIISFIRGGFKDEGKEWMKSGILGLLIIMTSYLIISTINPGLLIFDWRGLPKIILGLNDGTEGTSSGSIDFIYYDEIPIGKLTENLLTGKMNCYDFDAHGDPIPGEQITTDNGENIFGPTYINHDRFDCYLKLTDAAEKKALVVENLAKEISELMQQCNCQGKCDDTCNAGDRGCENPPIGGDCSNNRCAGAACIIPPAFRNTALQYNGSFSCCPDNIKKKIRGYTNTHGDGKATRVEPFSILLEKECSSSGVCKDDIPIDYYGLDEFYSTRSNIASPPVEITVQVNRERLTYIDLDNCPFCLQNCECEPGDQQCLRRQPQCRRNRQQCLRNRLQCIEQTPWGKLNLKEQLAYLKEKMEQIKQDIERDLEKLQAGTEKLANCPTPKSSIDFVKADEAVNQDSITLIANRSVEETQNYCKGFNYAQSQANQKCSEICPITKNDLSCYQNCSQRTCAPNDQACINQRNQCSSECYNNRECLYSSSFPNFKSCINNFRESCDNLCLARYLSCSDEFKTCQSLCKNDSKCLLDNLDSCVIDTNSLASCQTILQNGSNNPLIDSQIEKCINNSYKCRYGSQQNAGYPECFENPTRLDDYSSSYAYQNPQQQVCPNPFSVEGYYFGSQQPILCLDENPETTKCPTNSRCPDCKCDVINDDIEINFSLENRAYTEEINFCEDGPLLFPRDNNCTQTTQTVEKYRLVGPECSEPSFNGDPLTFYCRKDWWNEPETERIQNIGKGDDPKKTITCSRADEIPVGITVDQTVEWANKFLEIAEKSTTAIQNMISNMDRISNARNYCSCNSKYDSGEPICRSCCLAAQRISFINNQAVIVPYCQFIPCSGNPCQQVINYLIEMINYHRDIKESFIELYLYLLSEPRSDILKELTYSRDKIDEYSTIQDERNIENARLLNCQQILDEIIYPITEPTNKIIINQEEVYHYCYGVTIGKLLDNSNSKDPSDSLTPKTDNWFYCSTNQQTDESLPLSSEYNQ